MLLNNTLRYAEPQARPFPLRGEKWLEQPPQMLRSNSFAEILNRDREAALANSRANPNGSACCARLDRIHQHIQERLFELVRSSFHRVRAARQGDLQLDSFFAQSGLQQVD